MSRRLGYLLDRRPLRHLHRKHLSKVKNALECAENKQNRIALLELYQRSDQPFAGFMRQLARSLDIEVLVTPSKQVHFNS